jgi:hypothetical protein
MAKKVEIEGYGKIFLSGIEFKSAEGQVVDSQGNPLTRFSESVRGKSGWKDANGNIVASKETCRKMNIKGEDTIISKLKQTTKIAKGDLREKSRIDADYDFSNGGERKLYVITTDSKELRALLDDDKALEFPFVAGGGFKAWKGILRKHTTKKGKNVFTLGLTRGNIDKAFEDFADEPIEVEIGVSPDNQNAKKLVDLDE